MPPNQSTLCPPMNHEQPKKCPADLQALTTIQQDNFTPQPPPARGPITLTLCVTPHPSTTSRQHYFHRTAPLYMERRIFWSYVFGGEWADACRRPSPVAFLL